MAEFLIPLENMFLLLNGLFLGGGRSFTVRSLLLNLDLFRVTLGGPRETSSVSGLVSRELYEGLRLGCGEFTDEIPSYINLLEAFLAAGVHDPTGWGEAAEALLEALNWDPFKGHRPFYVSFDTNALIRRYYTRVSRLLKRHSRGAPLRVGFVASRGVLAELESFDEKYRDSDIWDMSEALKNVNRAILNQFFNQLKLNGRRFRMGFVEYRKMSRKEHFEEIEGEKGDAEIVRALEDFSKRRNVNLIVLSEDSDFIAKATTRRLRGIRLDRPTSIPEKVETSWEEITQLLYTTAVTFGAISLTGRVNAKIFGVWRGKKGEHWDSETLRIITENRQLSNFLETSLKILETP